MYKLLIQTQSLLNQKESPFRKIIKQQIEPKSEDHNKEGDNELQMFGHIHLYKNYRQESKATSEDVKLNLNANQIQIKAQVLLLNHILISQLPALKSHLQARKDQIQLIDTISEQLQQNHIHLILYLKTILASEQIFQLVLFNFHGFPLYIKEVIFFVNRKRTNNSKQFLQLSNLNLLQSNFQIENFVYNQKWIEIPLCVDCLQKLQYQLTGISVQLLQQLKKNNNIKCKTCQTISKIASNETTSCSLCASPQDNWICLVCSRIGCGRYKNADAFKHFLSDGHIITMDLQTQRVWNYLSDCFSHRVIPLEKQEITLKFPDYSHQKSNIKYEQSLESAFWEYCSVVSEQLERQRIFYQKQKIQEQERFKKENIKIETLNSELQSQLQEKVQLLKKVTKKYKKNEKRVEQLKQKCKFDKQILNNYEKTIKQQGKEQNLKQIEEKSSKIQQKFKILKSIDTQIESMLMKLSES